MGEKALGGKLLFDDQKVTTNVSFSSFQNVGENENSCFSPVSPFERLFTDRKHPIARRDI